MALAVLIVTFILTVHTCSIFKGNELMCSGCCFLKLFDVLWLTVLRPENNDVCPVVIPTLKILQVFPLTFCSAELQTHLKSTKNLHSMENTYQRNIYM